MLLLVVDAIVQMDETTTNLNTKILNLTRVGIFLGIVGGVVAVLQLVLVLRGGQ